MTSSTVLQKQIETLDITRPNLTKIREIANAYGKNQKRNVQLLEALEQKMASAHEMVREPMDWCAAQIGIEVESLRGRCLELGETLGLYKDYPVSKGCTSPYLPIRITTLVEKKGQSL